IHNNPIASYCSTEGHDDACAKTHTGLGHDHQTVAVDGTESSGLGSLSDADVLAYLDRLIRDLPSPDSVLRPGLDTQRKDQDVDSAVGEFSLQKGPAEVPAFHDFTSMQVAFEHVWQQLFDESIPNLAYTANTLGKAKFGIEGLFDS